ncbi:hypothetical protein ACSTHI_23550, partial [Vibrio parahaemolyticus]
AFAVPAGRRRGVGGRRYRGRVSTPRDDDALSWGGDDDPTLDVSDKRSVEREPSEMPPREAGSVRAPA